MHSGWAGCSSGSASSLKLFLRTYGQSGWLDGWMNRYADKTRRDMFRNLTASKILLSIDWGTGFDPPTWLNVVDISTQSQTEQDRIEQLEITREQHACVHALHFTSEHCCTACMGTLVAGRTGRHTRISVSVSASVLIGYTYRYLRNLTGLTLPTQLLPSPTSSSDPFLTNLPARPSGSLDQQDGPRPRPLRPEPS